MSAVVMVEECLLDLGSLVELFEPDRAGLAGRGG